MTAFGAHVNAHLSPGGEGAIADYWDLHGFSVTDPGRFWGLFLEFSRLVTEGSPTPALRDPTAIPGARWFPGLRLNFAENLLAPNWSRRDQEAVVFRGENGIGRRLTHGGLYALVARLAAHLEQSLAPGDRTAAILPNMPETVAAMLAVTSRGGVWSSCSPDFGVDGIIERFGQIAPRSLFVTDGYFYNGRYFSIADKLARILDHLPSVEQVIVLPYGGPADPGGKETAGTLLKAGAKTGATITPLADIPDAPGEIDFVRLPFDHPLYILFSSGTTGQPKCIVHGAGGTLFQHVKEHRLHLDIAVGDRVFYFTTCGWMMWNWLVSALASGATLMLYDGSPAFPGLDVLFDYAAAERLTHFGISAKYIDSLAKGGLAPRESHDLSALKAIMSTGSPLAPEGFDYVYENIKKDVHLASISGGTDIVSCFMLGSPTLPVWRGEIQCPGLGMKVEIFDDSGQPLDYGKGELVCTLPFPSIPVGFWNDPEGEKFRAAYFERFPGVWHHGDYIERTVHGGFIVHGRSDATLNPGGVRIGTAEIYRQVEQVPSVLESLAIGQEWQGDTRIVLFVRLRDGEKLDDSLKEEIRQRIRDHASPRHVPARIVQVADIPRTKSGKIVELAVREMVHRRPIKNREALANPDALELFRDLPDLAV